MPDGYVQRDKSFLNIEEIRRLAQAFIELGVKKIRLTGGEPIIRKDFYKIAETLTEISGLKKLALTTNGYHLNKNIAGYKSAGVDSITVSIDSLIPEKFKQLTGHNDLKEILQGLAEAQRLNFSEVKVNTVLLKGINVDETISLICR